MSATGSCFGNDRGRGASAFVALAFAGGLMGCGGLEESSWSSSREGESDQVTEAIGEGVCATAAANATFTGGATPAWVSPQTYGGSAACFKAVIVDVNSYSSSFLGPGDVPGGTFV